VRTTLLRTLGISLSAAVIAAFAYGASAQEKKAAPAKKPAACSTIKDLTACNAREDCSWAEEKKNAKGKVTAKAQCKAKPKPKPAKEKKK
jgi:hypothetical protein